MSSESFVAELARLLQSLPAGCGVRLLEARGVGGWGASSFAPDGLQILAMEFELEFRGHRDALEAALAWLAPGRCTDRWDRLLIGSLSYELGPELEPKAPVPSPSTEPLPPPVDLAGFRAVYVFDPGRRQGRILGEDPRARERLTRRLAQAGTPLPISSPRPSVPRNSLDQAAFEARVEAIRARIRDGEIYQANLTRRLSF